MESLLNSNVAWACLGFTLLAGVRYNDCISLKRITWLCGVSVLLGLEVARYSEEINAFLSANSLSQDLTYTIYAFLDVGIACFIISICRKLPHHYWAIPLIFFLSILTHATYVTLSLTNSDGEIFPIEVYTYIMVVLNILVIVWIWVFSDGFGRGLQYMVNILSRCYNTVFRKLIHSSSREVL